MNNRGVDTEMQMKKLIKTHLDTIFSYALFISGDRDKAMDLMQDTILTVLKKKELYNEQFAFRSWIFRVMKNTYINKYTKVSVSREINESTLSENENIISNIFEDKNTRLDSISDPLLKERILSVFANMPQEYKDVSYLVDIEGFSYEEVSKDLGIPVGTVMSRLHRGRDYLRNKLLKEAKELRITEKRKKRHA